MFRTQNPQRTSIFYVSVRTLAGNLTAVTPVPETLGGEQENTAVSVELKQMLDIFALILSENRPRPMICKLAVL